MNSFVRRFRDLLRSLCTLGSRTVGRIQCFVVLLRLLIEIDKGRLSIDRILDRPDLIFQNRGRRTVDVEDAGNLPLFLSSASSLAACQG